MKYLKRFNEELNSQTYLSASRKLRKMGNPSSIRRADALKDWAGEVELKEYYKLWEDEVTKYWKTVQKNIGAFQTFFGKTSFLVVDNSEGKDFKVETLRAYRDIKKFLDKKIENSIANKWIKDEKKKLSLIHI